MTIQECYQKLGGDYEQLQKRIPTAALINRFIKKFLDDGSFSELKKALEEGQRVQAFQAAHTLKGVCGNLSLDRLYDSASRLTELLREENDAIPPEAGALWEEVQAHYELCTGTIREYLAELEG